MIHLFAQHGIFIKKADIKKTYYLWNQHMDEETFDLEIPDMIKWNIFYNIKEVFKLTPSPVRTTTCFITVLCSCKLFYPEGHCVGVSITKIESRSL